MFRTKRSATAFVLVVVLCVFFLVSLFGESRSSSGSSGEGEVVEKASLENESSQQERDRYHSKDNNGEGGGEDYCTWSPEEQDSCKRVLSRRLSSGRSTLRRWLFMGDSTVQQFWNTSSLSQIMVDFGLSELSEACSRRYKCSEKVLQQCHLNQEFGLPSVSQWERPNWDAGEGPANLTNTDCFGCKNCLSNYPYCDLVDDDRHCRRSKRLLYGGYIAMPYTRDVLLQTPSFKTTQENILKLVVEPHFNTPDLHDDFEGNPICVVRTGFHDMAIPGMTSAKYVANVQWFLPLLQSQCSHVVWLQNPAPLLHDDTTSSTPKYSQTVERVRDYDLGVYKMISSHPTFQAMVTTMDVFDASKDWTHSDNVHLDSAWNRALGMFFVKLATKLVG